MDLKFALRSLRNNPGFTLLAIVVMALGIGANTAVFSVVNSVLLKPLAYKDPDRIVTIRNFWKEGRRGQRDDFGSRFSRLARPEHRVRRDGLLPEQSDRGADRRGVGLRSCRAGGSGIFRRLSTRADRGTPVHRRREERRQFQSRRDRRRILAAAFQRQRQRDRQGNSHLRTSVHHRRGASPGFRLSEQVRVVDPDEPGSAEECEPERPQLSRGGKAETGRIARTGAGADGGSDGAARTALSQLE